MVFRTASGVLRTADGFLGEAPASGSPSYADEVLADNPVAWWRFSETSGSTVADQVGSNDGTVVGANLDVSGPDGLGSAASFDGVDDAVYADNALTANSGTATFEAWVLVPDGHDGTFSIISEGDNTSVNAWTQFCLHADAGMAVCLVGRSTIDYERAEGNTPLNDGIWHHVVAVVDDAGWDGVAFYVDGVADGTGNTNPPDATRHDVACIGALRRDNNNLADFAQGRIDEVAIYDYALSSARIQAHYNAAGVA